MRNGRRTVPAGAAAVAAAAVALYAAGGLEWAERHLMDLRFSLLSRQASGRIAVVAVDPKSLSALDTWPWPRGYHATLLEHLLAAGAERVAFDVDFSSWSVEEEDLALEEALRAAGGRAILPIFRQTQLAPDGLHRLVATRPLEAFAAHARLATINIEPDGDGLVRRYGRGEREAGDWPVPLALALAGGAPEDGGGRRPDGGRFYLDFGIDPSGIPRLSYLDVLTGSFPAEAVAGRVAIVGATAVELGDQAPVPLHAALPGPVLQALAFESLASGRALRRLPPWQVGFVVLIVGLAAGVPMQRVSWRAGLAVLALASTALLAAALAIQRVAPVILDVAPTGAALAGCYGLALVRRIDQEELRAWLASIRARRSEIRMRHVVDNCSEAILTLDEDGRIETFNRAAEALFGLRAARALGRSFDDLVPGLSPPLARRPAAEEGRDVRLREERQHRAAVEGPGGVRRMIDVEVSGFDLDGRLVRVAFLRDVTESLDQQAALEHQATHDALTELPNRTLLARRIEEVLKGAPGGAPRAALLMLDLDRFKEINDTLGHATGDLLLRRIAARLGETLGPGGTVARLGGDEFAVLLPGAGAGAAEIAARRLLDALVPSFEVQGMLLQVDGSVGIALCPDHGQEPGPLLQRADVAMYAAKKRRNTFSFYDAEADASSLRHLTLKGDMREAIDRDLLELHYQPKIALDTEEVVGAEALLRWRHPRHGPLPPAEFVPLAERTGLIKPLTHWVLREALAQARRWEAAGTRMRLAVNCSARNLLEDDLPGTIERMLRAAGIAPDHLILEITETAIIEDPGRSLRVLKELAALGVELSIDDFGTAYSSLDYLRKLPAHELKIDRSFVSGAERDEGDATIVRATIRLARDFGLRAVAEGIESQAMMDRLRVLGCHHGQGYFIAPPMPAAAFESWLARRAAARAVAAAGR